MNELSNLNKQQDLAVRTINEHLRIIAGPGSGKTKTIISKIIFLINNNVSPNNIIVFTFTNKAANEIKRRILDELGIEFINIYTYHRWASYFLRREARDLSIDGNFKIIDRFDQTKLVKELSVDLSVSNELKPGEILNYISNYSSHNKDELNIQRFVDYFKDLRKIYQDYTNEKNNLNVFDFDDLLKKVNVFLDKNEFLRNKYKKFYKHILIDEFQDTNNIQFQIIKNILGSSSFLTIVGDPDQNIYSWRGSNIKLILDFEKFFSSKTILLNKNYRSNPDIIDVSNMLIRNNKSRVDFQSEAIKKEETKSVFLIEASNDFDEADLVARKIEMLRKDKNISLHRIAIIYRNNYTSTYFQHALNTYGLRFKVIGGKKFFDRIEIKESLMFLTFLLTRNDFFFRSIINVPSKGIGNVRLRNFTEAANASKKSLWEYLNSLDENEKPNNLKLFIDSASKIIKTINYHNFDVLLKKFLVQIGYMDYISKKGKDDSIQELFKQLANIKGRYKSINELLDFISLSTSNDDSEEKNHITLITIHAAKGLEFDYVFFVSVNKDVIPSSRARTLSAIEEERRVAYVAMTRAKENLYISYNKFTPSRFIYEIRGAIFDETVYDSNYYNNTKDTNFIINENKEVNVDDKIMHQKFGKGTIINKEKDIMLVQFDRKVGAKKILLGHKSYKIL